MDVIVVKGVVQIRAAIADVIQLTMHLDLLKEYVKFQVNISP